jgi:hypothetical protein
MIAASRLVMFPKTTLPEITATIEDQMSKFFEESRTSALAEARGLVEFFNQPLPVNSRTALVERCYQVQLICETIPAHENQTKTAIALSELVTAIRESGGRDETLADLKSARDGLQRLTGAIKRSDELYQQYEFMRNQLAASQSRVASLERELAEAREEIQRHHILAADVRYLMGKYPMQGGTNLTQLEKADKMLLEIACGPAALHPATKEGK